MQIHTPGAHVGDGKFDVRLNPGHNGEPPFAVIHLDPGGSLTKLFMETPGDCDRLMAAAAKAKLLLGETTAPVPAAITASPCQHPEAWPLAGMTGNEIVERYLDGRGRNNLERLLTHISGYCPEAFLEAVSAIDAAASPDHPFASPGLVAADRPAPDACMTCGLPRKPSHPTAEDDAGRAIAAMGRDIVNGLDGQTGMRP
jgi:hypothetical protein